MNKKKLSNNQYFSISIVTLIFLFGSYLAISRGSNFSDGDSYTLILSFLNFLDFNTYDPSRGAYGHLIPEILLGSTAYLFGTPISNFICFLFFFSSIYILFITFFEKNFTNFATFLLLISSNFYLFTENTNTIDYPIALFFFSLGLFFLKKENFIYTSILFSIAICSRASFCVFIYPVIFLYFFQTNIIYKKMNLLILTLTLTTLIGLIFFIPVFYVNNFTLDFLNIPFITNSNTPGWYGGPPLNFNDLFPRFLFKIYKLVGSLSSFIIILIFFFNINVLISFKTIQQKFIWGVIIINLFLYFLIPTKILLINPFLIFLYILLFTHFKKKVIYSIIILNFITWFISFDLLKIKYKNDNICEATVAVSAKFNFSLRQGDYIKFLNSPSLISCYSGAFREYSDNFINSRPLKLSSK